MQPVKQRSKAQKSCHKSFVSLTLSLTSPIFDIYSWNYFIDMTTEKEKNKVHDHEYDQVYKSKASINKEPGRDSKI